MSISTELKTKLIYLAQKYETKEFLDKDPSKFMHQYKEIRDIETVAFIAANMAFGQRGQILSHIEQILNKAGANPSVWVQKEGYKIFFTQGNKSFYRIFTHNDFLIFFDTLKSILDISDTIGNYICHHQTSDFLHQTICNIFPLNCALIPHSKTTSAKKVNMLLRWMVRTNSPVDLGLWSSWASKENLLIPLDTHVMQEATKMNILPTSASGKTKSATLKTAIELTQAMKEVFPEDPTKADFALFGLGVNSSS